MTTLNKTLVGVLLVATSSVAHAEEKDQKVESQVTNIINEMTQSEKIDYIHVSDGHLLPPVDRFNLPGTNSVDSAMGVKVKATKLLYGTSFPSQLSLASTWNVELAKELGLALGYETRMSGAEHFLSPVVNMYRTPLGGRNAETLCGEDPFLCSVLAPAMTNAVQVQGVAATVKHWLGNEQDVNRKKVNAVIDERTMREIYMPAFESLVKNSDPASFMCGFNYINGDHACSSDYLINDVLKGEWGYPGYVSSDFDSITNTYEAAVGGTDMDQPSGNYFTEKKLMPYLEDGSISQSVIDNKVRRNMRALFKNGFNETVYDAQELDNRDHGEQASIDVAREGIVLLKNKGASQGAGGLLPLSKDAKIAVIGDMAQNAPASPFGTCSTVPQSGYVTELSGLRELANSSSNVDFIEAMSLTPKTAVWNQTTCTNQDDSCDTGVEAEYYSNLELSGEPVLTRVESGVNFDWEAMTNETADETREITDFNPEVGAFSARFTTKIKPTIDGRQVIKVRADGPFKLWLDGDLIMKSDGVPLATDLVDAIPKSAKTKMLEAGKLYKVKLEYSRERKFTPYHGGIRGLQMSWASLEVPADLSEYDAVVAFVGHSAATEGETVDHDYTLPDHQGYMLEAVTQANPNTVVVMHGGSAMLMKPWIDYAGAALHAFYSGQFGGQALAEILYGDVNPSARLPMSIDQWVSYNPSYEYYSDPEEYLGDDAKTTMVYGEGLNMGYRGYQTSAKKPLYPFGYGLSYTEYSFSDLKLSSTKVLRDDVIKATVTVTNTGSQAGYQVAQLYVQPLNSDVERPDHELKGFAKVYLEAGESKKVTIPLNARSFSYYNETTKTWYVPQNASFNILVGGDSEDLPVSATVSAPQEISVGTDTSNPLPKPVQNAVQVSEDLAY
ncbi:beta-glucosidase [Vibrio xiamenensis]|uniref:Beta-D-glucoside glucohydrolase n=1 Tax=Vibrio xiamenensis TaxID=861298 RepID=A0A1G8GDD2_9VIBR|nr:glycoside hydrolase family 3 C-terminal domain-containing protein [Vibrio xiamenensis]SDH92321.1 beta-glucosidase [Vibrio xiamenensis]